MKKPNNTKKLLALTFDDGPAETTEMIISSLMKNRAVATFFVNGACLRKFPHLTKMAFDCGFEIGNHTTTHKHLPKLKYQEVVEEISQTSSLIEEIIHINPKIMRPPYGEYNETVKEAAKYCGLPLINWSNDPKDWNDNKAETTRKKILENLQEDAIILCHDRILETAYLMLDFISELQGLGYQLVTVSHLFELKGIPLQAGEVYNCP